MDKITLKAARVNAGLTQAQAAELIGVCTHSLVRYEKGESVPRGDTLVRITQVYKKPVDGLIFCPESR